MTKAVVTLSSTIDREKVCRWAMNVAPQTIVEFRKATRSSQQNALLWSCLTDLSKQVNWYGQYLSAEDWKDVLTASLRHCRVVPGIDKGTFVPLGMRTSQMTIPEMSELLELLFAFGAEHGVTFTDPGAPPSTPGNTSAGQPHRSADASLEGVR
jgi:hypothetical protein